MSLGRIYVRVGRREIAAIFSQGLPILLCVLVATVLVFLFVGARSQGTTRPSISDNVRDVDLGKLSEGQEPSHVFTIHNTSGNAFKITAIQKTCSCQEVNVAEGKCVAPDDNLKIAYALPSHVAGPQSGRLTIATDSTDEAFKQIVLTLRAEIPAKLWTTPRSLAFDNFVDGKSSEQELRVESLVPGLLEHFREVTSSRGQVAARLKQKSADALVFEVGPTPDVPAGESYDFVRLKFDDIVYGEMIVRVRINKRPQLTAVPNFLVLERFNENGIESRHLCLRSLSHQEFQITRIDSPENIALEGALPAAGESIDLTFKISKPDSVRTADAIEIHTESLGIVTVPIEYFRQKKAVDSVMVSKKLEKPDSGS